MSDAWGDDYGLEIEASTEEEAWRKAIMVDDDAVPQRLLEVK